MNLYCRLIRKDEKSADYAAGSSLEHLNGVVRFYSDEQQPEIIRPWGEYAEFERYKLHCLYIKYKDVCLSGSFPEKMSRITG